jgi:hypothetical protein
LQPTTPLDPTPSAVATSTTIAQTYGFAPSLIVPLTPILIYQAINPQPGQVTGVVKVQLIPRSGEYARNLFDQFA